jgi:uncharacterized protein YndB with AHSA1/START domain
VEQGRRIEVEDGFTDQNGMPNDGLPHMRMVFTFEPTDTGSRFTGVTHFPSVEAMQQMIEMGMLEGMQSAMGQLDGVLAEPAPVTAERAG